MAAAVALLSKERGGPPIKFQLLFYPVTDANFDTPSYMTYQNGPCRWAGERPSRRGGSAAPHSWHPRPASSRCFDLPRCAVSGDQHPDNCGCRAHRCKVPELSEEIQIARRLNTHLCEQLSYLNDAAVRMHGTRDRHINKPQQLLTTTDTWYWSG